MAILSDNIKFYKSGKMNDRDDAGGMATAQEILGGVSNEIMPDLSPLNRAQGTMLMRKLFAQINTSDTSVYLGAHTILTKIPKDQRLATFMFDSSDYHDIRSEASDKFAAYRTRSARYQGVLWATQWQDSKTLLLFQPVDSPTPKNNEVYEIVDSNNPNNDQFVRVVDVTQEIRSFTTNNSTFEKNIVTLTLSQPLSNTFSGVEIQKDDSVSSDVSLYSTSVADASKIYTSKPLTADIVVDESTCQIDTPFIQAVPASAGFKGLLNQQAYTANKSGGRTGSLLSFITAIHINFFSGKSIQMTPFDPSTFEISGTNQIGLITIQGEELLHNGVSVGTADPFNGVITMNETLGAEYVTLKYKQMASIKRVGATTSLEITSANVSSTYTHQFPKNIERGSVVVQYKSLGENYILRDNFNSALSGDGSGVIDFDTRSVSVTLNSLPDEGSVILWSYSTSIAERTVTNVTGLKFEIKIPITGRNIDQSTVSISWDVNNVTKTITQADDTEGTFVVRGNTLHVRPTTMVAKHTVVSTSFSYTDLATLDLDEEQNEYNPVTNEWTINSPSPDGEFTAGKFKVIQYHQPQHAQSGWSYLQMPTTSPTVSNTYVDNGLGDITLEGSTDVIGSINYNTGVVVFTPSGQYVKYEHSVGWNGGTWRAELHSATIPSTQVRNIKLTTPVTNNSEVEARNDTVTEISCKVELLAFEGAVSHAGVSFKYNGRYYAARDHNIYKFDGLLNGQAAVGSIDERSSEITMTEWTIANNSLSELFMNFVASTDQVESSLAWFTESAPIQNGSIQGEVSLLDGTLANFTSDTAGQITSTNSSITGSVNSQMGIAQITSPVDMIVGSMRYNVTIQEVIPVDADIIKMDTVRLPIDGRLPAYRKGDLIVAIHDEETTGTVSNTDVQTLRDDTSYVRILDFNGDSVPATAYTLDLDAHTLTWDDVTGVAMPVTVVDRVENLRVLTKVNNSGELTVRDPFTFAFPANETLICSAMVHTDVFASVTSPFDQTTWYNNWRDTAEGSLSLGGYNDTINPIQVSNQGAIDDRWLILFKSSSIVDVISENLGVLLSNVSVASVISPINAIQGVPYFTIPAGALDTGFSGGNVVRFNTISASVPIWMMESISFGEPTDTSDDAHTFCMETRGAVDA